MISQTNLDNGDLGRSKYIYKLGDLEVLFKTVGSIFEKLEPTDQGIPFFGCEVHEYNSELLELYVKQMARSLPERCKLHEVSGKVIFDVMQGSEFMYRIFYIIKTK